MMNDTEDYPGPTHNHPEKQGQAIPGRADESMVKPPVKPRRGGAKNSNSRTKGKP